jgi:dolichol-phosphate mannosyltransferase
MTDSPQVAVIVPVRNEAPNILPLIAEIETALGGRFRFEIIYVDDGSSDQSPDILAQAQAGHPQLRAFRHDPGCGQSQAIATGVSMARAPLIATLSRRCWINGLLPTKRYAAV